MATLYACKFIPEKPAQKSTEPLVLLKVLSVIFFFLLLISTQLSFLKPSRFRLLKLETPDW